MKRAIFYLITFLFCFDLSAQTSKTTPLYVDNQGVLRRTSTNKEVSYCGTNFTLPFAHSYRAAGYLGVDRYKAIDNEVYHFARLGFNAFRLHLWDVEISDDKGNLIENEHLKVLDYLVKKLEERNIDIIFTTQTNFGNGYPEKNINTGAFSYLYDKNMVHSDPKAVEAQKNYIKQLALHKNSYTGKSYLEDTCIVAFEINNEPSHVVSKEDTKNYINTMVKVLKDCGFNKPIFYNVSHNHDFVQAYYDAEIDGTTYQWYPLGLVSGRELNFNFLPYVDNYRIDFKDVNGFNNRAKMIYEFDPGDLLDSYLFPAVIRSFRTAGFQWITQFAYDATFLAAYNTDYQTHYLNLFYTPGKAIGLKISCELAKTIPLYKQFPKYPADTVFYGATVSYSRNLALYNTDEKYFYTNNHEVKPVNEKKLKEICGLGSSPVVKYSGTGAYFLDQLDKGIWRLEILPDQIIVNDPFNKPSLKRKVGVLVNDFRTMEISLADIGTDYTVENVSPSADYKRLGKVLTIKPGVYLLRAAKTKVNVRRDFKYNNIKVSEYFGQETNVDKIYLVHEPKPVTELGEDFKISAKVVAPQSVDSVVIYPSDISFWRESNKSIQMKKVSYYDYEVVIPKNWYYKGVFQYNILVFANGNCTTFPSDIQGNPLDWDYDDYTYYSTQVVDKNDNAVLISSAADDKDVFVKILPTWNKSNVTKSINMPLKQNALYVYSKPSENQFVHAIVYKDIRGILQNRTTILGSAKKIKLMFQPLSKNTKFSVGFVDNKGITFSVIKEMKQGDEFLEINLSDLRQSATYFLNESYPVFSETEFSADQKLDFSLSKAEIFEVMTEKSNEIISFGFIGAWIE